MLAASAAYASPRHATLTPWQLGYRGGRADRHYFPEVSLNAPEDWRDFLDGHRAGQMDFHEAHPPYRKKAKARPKPQQAEIQDQLLALLRGEPRTAAELKAITRRNPETVNVALSALRKRGEIYTQVDEDGKYRNYVREPRP